MRPIRIRPSRATAFLATVASHGGEVVRERQARSAFRTNLIKKLGTDFSVATLTGVLAADGDDIREKNNHTLTSGIVKANDALGSANARGVRVNLYLTPADLQELQPFFQSASGGFAEIPEANARHLLFRTNGSKNPGTLLVHNNPIANFCMAESASDKCALLHTGGLHEPAAPPTGNPPGSTVAPITDGQMLTYIDRLVRDIPAPDMVLRPDLATKRADKASIEKTVNDFSLPKGPAAVPAFYDFNTLQIAFEHVWKQLFDEAIPNLAYTANAIGRATLGLDAVVADSFKNGLLVAELFYSITPVEVPPAVARLFDVTKEEFNELSPTLRQELVYIANQIHECSVSTTVDYGLNTLKHSDSRISDLRIVQSFTEQGERLIDAVRHNFGVMNTYRQQWTPLMVQAGKLVKTIPLAPKEERKYSVRINRQEKRKEAKKNNRSITNEQSSSSRVEAEIMAKAQNKTNFGLTTEGDFSVGIYEGKGTTTFGVEALSESSQNRKDFREAVLKAVQDYKDETSMEVTTDSELTSESTESGTIVNPNDELAVTYLFYERSRTLPAFRAALPGDARRARRAGSSVARSDHAGVGPRPRLDPQSSPSRRQLPSNARVPREQQRG